MRVCAKVILLVAFPVYVGAQEVCANKFQNTFLDVFGCMTTGNYQAKLEEEKRFVQLRVTTKGIRLIDKKGIEVVVAELRARGEKV